MLSRTRAARASSICVTRGNRNRFRMNSRIRKLTSWAIRPGRLMPSASTAAPLRNELDDQRDDERVDRDRLGERQPEDEVAADGRLGLRVAPECLHGLGREDA